MTLARYAVERDLIERLTAEANGKRCARCRARAVVAWIRGQFVLRCGCYPLAPVLVTYDKDKERYNLMTQDALTRAQNTGDRAMAAITIQEIKQLLCPLATDIEATLFLNFCRSEGLNPFVNDAYLVKYDSKAKAAIVVGVGTYLKRAARHPDFRGYWSGIIVKDKTEAVIERSGTMEYPGDELLGGWATVFMVGRKDFHHTVGLKEYNKGWSQWKERPATMIEKVAYAQALKRCIPEIDIYHDEGGTVRIDVQENDTTGQAVPLARQLEDIYVDGVAYGKEIQIAPAAASDVDALFGPSKDFPDAGTLLNRVWKEYRVGKDAFVIGMNRITKGGVKTEADLRTWGYERCWTDFVADQAKKP